MAENLRFEDVAVGSRFLYRRSYSPSVKEDLLLERSPSGDFLKFEVLGWLSRADANHLSLLEVIDPPHDAEEMCPNCVTPWKCNGPHIPCRGAPGGSPQLQRYLDQLGIL